MPACLRRVPRHFAGLTQQLQSPGYDPVLFVLVHGLSHGSRREPECHLSLGTSHDFDGGLGRNRTTDTRIFSTAQNKLSCGNDSENRCHNVQYFCEIRTVKVLIPR
jgi:hypothetical protein